MKERKPTLNLPEKGGYVSLMAPHLHYALAWMSSHLEYILCLNYYHTQPQLLIVNLNKLFFLS